MAKPTDENVFTLDSKEELDKQPSEFSPLDSGNYIAKVVNIDFVDAPTFVKSVPNYSVATKVFKTILMICATEAAAPMKDLEGTEVTPLTQYLFRDINPFSIKFGPDGVTPSFARAFIAYMNDQPVTATLNPPGFILLDANNKMIEDEATRKQFLAEIKADPVKRELIKSGHKGIPDLRPYAGKYIGCSLEIDKKGRNKVTRFGKVPSTFKEPADDVLKEAMEKYEVFYQEKVLVWRAREIQKFAGGVSDIPVADDVPLDDIPL